MLVKPGANDELYFWKFIPNSNFGNFDPWAFWVLALVGLNRWIWSILTLNINIDIGTNILHFQCFVTTDMFLFCKPIFFSGICRIFRDLAFGSVKTRFKAILKKSFFRPEFACGQLSWSFSNQNKLWYMLQASFEHEK